MHPARSAAEPESPTSAAPSTRAVQGSLLGPLATEGAAVEEGEPPAPAADLTAAGGGHEGGRGQRSSLRGGVRTGPLFCQVEGCAAPLEALKDYHQR